MLKVRLSEQDLYLMPSKNMIGYSFRDTFVNLYENENRTGKVFFMFRRDGTRQFSNSFFFDIRPINGVYFTYEIDFQFFKIVEDDKFEALKDFRKFFVETINIDDATTYLGNLIENFRNDHRLTTLELSLENHKKGSYESFELEVDDGLFRQHYLQKQNVSDHKYPSCADSKKSFYSIFTQYNKNIFSRTWFTFSISMASRETNISNEDNYAKLVQNILNSLSLFLNLNILECHVYVPHTMWARFSLFLVSFMTLC